MEELFENFVDESVTIYIILTYDDITDSVRGTPKRRRRTMCLCFIKPWFPVKQAKAALTFLRKFTEQSSDVVCFKLRLEKILRNYKKCVK